MKMGKNLWIIAVVICLVLLVHTAYAEGIMEKEVIYETDFSSNPGWITNSPSHYYWDGDLQMYYFNTEGGTNGNSYTPIEYNGESFTLEFDVVLKSTKKGGAFRFGVTSSEMDVTRGTNVLSVFEDGKYGKLMLLRVIDQNNHIHEVSSLYSSYCGSQTDCTTKEFEEDRPYHVILKYNKDLQNADIRISDKETGEVIWGYYVPIGQDLHFLSRLAVTTKGDYTMGNNVEGYLDNVEMSVYKLVEKTPTPTTPPTTFTATTTLATVTSTATTSPTPTEAPLTPVAALGSVFFAMVVFFSWKRR
jgi:hypothetical protein